MSAKRKPGGNQAPKGNNEHMNNTLTITKKQASNTWEAQIPRGFDKLKTGKDLLMVRELSTARKLIALDIHAVAIKGLFAYKNDKVEGLKAKIPVSGLREAVESFQCERIIFARGFSNTLNIDLCHSATGLYEIFRSKGISIEIVIGEISNSELDSESLEQLLRNRIDVTPDESPYELAKRIVPAVTEALDDVSDSRRREVIASAQKQIHRVKRHPELKKLYEDFVRINTAKKKEVKASKPKHDTLGSIVLTARVLRCMGLDVVRSTELSGAVVEVQGIPHRQFAPKDLARVLAPFRIRPTAVSVGPNLRRQGYHLMDILSRINAGGAND